MDLLYSSMVQGGALVLHVATHLGEQLPQLLVLVDPEHVVAGEDGGAGHGEDVVDVEHQVGDVAQGEQAEDHLLARGRGPQMSAF